MWHRVLALKPSGKKHSLLAYTREVLTICCLLYPLSGVMKLQLIEEIARLSPQEDSIYEGGKRQRENDTTDTT